MLSELMDELVEDSPFLRQLRDETLARGTRQGREEGQEVGQIKEARLLLRHMAQVRFPTLTEADLASAEAITQLDRLHTVLFGLPEMPDADAFRRALRDAQA